MDKYIERLFDNNKNNLDEIYNIVEDLINELSDLQDKYIVLEKQKEDLEDELAKLKLKL